MDNVIALRLAERMLAVLIGGIAIYLGYRLFLAIPASSDAEGRFTLPWNTSVVLSRVGPGVFFALFGSIIVGTSLYVQIKYSDSGPGGSTVNEFVGATPQITSADFRADARMRLQRDIAVLNTIPRQLDSRLTSENKSTVEFAIPRIKLALMEAVWDESWGEPAAFRKWIESGSSKVLPGFEAATEYYNIGTKANP